MAEHSRGRCLTHWLRISLNAASSSSTPLQKMHHLQSHSLLGGDWTPLINRLANDVHDPSQGLWAHRDSDGGTSVQNLLSTNQTLSTVHGNGTHCVLPCTEPSFLLNIQAAFICFHNGPEKVWRSVFLPRCWATSKTSLDSRPDTSRALRMGGRPSSNWTSTTAPMTATMRPLAVAAAAAGAA